jgi:ionotropic glutamate receptor
VVVSVFI